MNTQTVEALELGLEKRYWQAIKDKDMAEAEASARTFHVSSLAPKAWAQSTRTRLFRL